MILGQVYSTLNRFTDESMVLEPLSLDFGAAVQFNIPCKYDPETQTPDDCTYTNGPGNSIMQKEWSTAGDPVTIAGIPLFAIPTYSDWTVLDLPAVNLVVTHQLEFYEREERPGEGGKTALSRIEIE